MFSLGPYRIRGPKVSKGQNGTIRPHNFTLFACLGLKAPLLRAEVLAVPIFQLLGQRRPLPFATVTSSSVVHGAPCADAGMQLLPDPLNRVQLRRVWRPSVENFDPLPQQVPHRLLRHIRPCAIPAERAAPLTPLSRPQTASPPGSQAGTGFRLKSARIGTQTLRTVRGAYSLNRLVAEIFAAVTPLVQRRIQRTLSIGGRGF